MKKFITDHIAIFVVAAIAIGVLAYMKVGKLNKSLEETAPASTGTETENK